MKRMVALVASAAVSWSAASCNAILDNPEGHLADTRGGDAGDEGEPGGRAGSGKGGTGGQGGAADAGASARGGAEPTAGGASGGDGGSLPVDECSEDEDCVEPPETTPADCAERKCNRETKTCELVARDADGDEHRAKDCTAEDVSIVVGDDCDDGDPEALPGAWDGPPSDDESNPDRCDDVDQNCDGTPDNDQLTVDGETKSCACDPERPRPCFEYPNGAAIPANLLNVGICAQGTQACNDGVPGSCEGAVGPKTETCNDLDDDCDGVKDNNDPIGAFIVCEDADNDAYCTNKCMRACETPAGYREQGSCRTGLDCNDNASRGRDIHPGAPELCGDGVDSNCAGGDSDAFPELGQRCVNGTYGVCRRIGKYVCAASGTSTACDAAMVEPSGYRPTAATDTDIDTSTARSDYDPRWDWNCDNAVTATLGSQGLWDGVFRSRACEGNYEYACNYFAASSAECKDGVLGTKFFTCSRSGVSFLTIPAVCGTPVSYISCLPEFYDVNQCDYITNTYKADNGPLDCQ
jgi:hypothetical protein